MKKSIIIILSALLLIYITGMPCIVKQLVGIPCPGCGMTRAYAALLRFDLSEAFRMHPLFIMPVIIPFILLLRNKTIRNILLYLALALYIGVYIYRMALYFPHTAPMDFNNSSIIFKLHK